MYYCICYAQRSKTLIERKKWLQRVVALEKQLQREIACCGSFKQPQRVVAWEKLPQCKRSFKFVCNNFGSSAESGANACVFRHVRRCSQLSVSRFPVNRQSFRTYHLPQVTGILPALSATLFGEGLCVTSVILVFFGKRRRVVCSCVCNQYNSCVFWATFFRV